MVRVDHRLVCGRTQVNDRQPAMADANRPFDPLALAVRPAVRDGVGLALLGHRRHGLRVGVDQPGDAAHQRIARNASTT
jgi:hypothetical protein